MRLLPDLDEIIFLVRSRPRELEIYYNDYYKVLDRKVIQRIKNRLYARTPTGRINQRNAQEKYEQTDKGKKARKRTIQRYRSKPQNKDKIRNYSRRYQRSNQTVFMRPTRDPERIKKRNRKEYANRPEVVKEKQREYKRAIYHISRSEQKKFKEEMKLIRLFTCERCGILMKSENLLVHHRICPTMNNKLWNARNNCVVLCPSCHKFIHNDREMNLGFFIIENVKTGPIQKLTIFDFI